VPAPDDRKRSKADALAEDGTLSPAPDKVGDPKFHQGEFFDPRDVVQVKYEMLRRVSVEKTSVTDMSDQYGISRPTFYQAKADFDEGGIFCGPGAAQARSTRSAQDSARSAGVSHRTALSW
jgi:hypothetical protein